MPDHAYIDNEYEDIDIPVLDYRIRRSPYTGNWWVETAERKLLMFVPDEKAAHEYIAVLAAKRKRETANQ